MIQIIDPQIIIDKLNQILLKDSIAISALIEHRIPCSDLLGKDETVQCNFDKDINGFTVGMLGIINGLVGVKDDGWGFIQAEYDDNDKLIKFSLNEKDRSTVK